MSRTVSLLVASVGNPGSLALTRHSAGHIVLGSLRSTLSFPDFSTKDRRYQGGEVSRGSSPDYALFKCSKLMNVSGPPILKAWKAFNEGGSMETVHGFVLLHDEMEVAPGQLRIVRGGAGSAKGHNGIKSVKSSFQSGGLLDQMGDRFIRIGIGIGRPPNATRDPNDVAKYVLQRLDSEKLQQLEDVAGQVAGVLRQEVERLSSTR